MTDEIKELLERMRSPHNSLVTQSFLLNEGANCIEKLESAQDWQPIETAPKDGTMVFVWFPDMPKAFLEEYEGRIKLGRFVEGLQEWSVQDVGGNIPPKVTHWRPLFDPPKGTEDDG